MVVFLTQQDPERMRVPILVAGHEAHACQADLGAGVQFRRTHAGLLSWETSNKIAAGRFEHQSVARRAGYGLNQRAFGAHQPQIVARSVFNVVDRLGLLNRFPCTFSSVTVSGS